MVRLLDITEANGIIKFICVPEGKVDNAYIVEYNKNTRSIINGLEMNIFIAYAIRRLNYYLDNNLSLPKEDISMWY